MMLENLKITIVIDVFRAFTTACYVLEKCPSSYYYTYSCEVIEKLASSSTNPLLIGKPEKGSKLQYHIPNSPTRVLQETIKDRIILHRSEAGSRGILSAYKADLVLVAGFVNAQATADYIGFFKNAIVTILPMGHEAVDFSLEDEICSQYLYSLLYSKSFDPSVYTSELILGPGKYFFSHDQNQYPRQDFERCLELNRFNFAIKAQLHSDHSLLESCNIDRLKSNFVAQSVTILSKNRESHALANVVR